MAFAQPDRRQQRPGLVISCEHGGNQIPAQYRELFSDQQALLDSHCGFDAGALCIAKDFAKSCAAPLLSSTTSRLLVDLNRSIGHRRLHGKTIAELPPTPRQQILRQYYQPYREQVERLVRQAVLEHGQVLHLSVHSFTPELEGKVRNADIGLLYDPCRVGELAFCARWQADLHNCLPHFQIRRNYPYAGKNDGLTTWLRRQFLADVYIGIELEINQKHIVKAGRRWNALRKVLTASLCRVLVNSCLENTHTSQ
ncbi:N-formylglutamate amidohydrolase [Methylomonas paludis]|uniref:N-formylglutamate amidohydrolase n=1 Tax=Methylomonas paludis TaxID=1173101 RepID=A0A975MRA4_9GAMM|nr:N-formylglutamate amidohydrolase [Methylomonas paludis]